MINADRSPAFRVRPVERFQLYKQMDEAERRSSSSTTRTPRPRHTRPGPTSPRSGAAGHYVLVPLRRPANQDGPVELRSYRILDGGVTEEEIEITE
jgi:hypothetical protein